ncbi:hypothetical protein ACFLXG_03975, partial [Chloroflexota bacterium]
MKKVLCVALVLVVSLSLIFGAYPAFAQTDENEETTTLPVVDSDNQTTPEVFVVNDALMEELDRLLRALEEAEYQNDQRLMEALREKIRVIKEEISRASEKPKVLIGEPKVIKQPGSTEEVSKPEVVVIAKPEAVPKDGTVTEVTSNRIDPCTEARALEEKLRYYEALYALSDEELKDKGYSRGREELRITIANLEQSIKRFRAECETGVSDSGGAGGGTISPTETGPAEVVTPRPIAVASGGEITDYYRLRIAEIAIEEVEIEKHITSLKELRNEIDKLIEELIKSRAEITAREVSGLVERIEVRPGEVKMDNVVVKTVDKSIVARVDDKELSINPTEAQVILRDGNLEIKALELSIENEVLRVGTSEVKLRPST